MTTPIITDNTPTLTIEEIEEIKSTLFPVIAIGHFNGDLILLLVLAMARALDMDHKTATIKVRDLMVLQMASWRQLLLKENEI